MIIINNDTYEHKSNNDGKNDNKEPYNINKKEAQKSIFDSKT